MFEIYCPYCKEHREEGDFTPAGEAFIGRPIDPESLSDEQWADYVFYRSNHKGEQWEQWVHTAGCRKYFLVRRSTIDHSISEVSAILKEKKGI